MIHWPAIGTRRIEAEPVDLGEAGPNGNAPALSPAEPECGSARAPMRGRRAGWTALAIAVSTAVHAAALVLLADKMMRNGEEAADAPASVEIVLEGADATARPPIAGAEPQSPHNAAETVPPVETADSETAPTEPATVTPSETAPETAAMEPPEAEAAKPSEALQPRETIAMVDMAGVPPSTEPSVTAVASLPATDAASPVPAQELEAVSVEKTEALDEARQVALPTEAVPIPTPRPQPPAPAKPARAQNRTAKSGPGHPAKAAPTAKQTTSAQPKTAARSQPAQAGRTGGATAGEKAAYARRLMRHVERYKRYPKAAERQGITGAAGLSITIDRAGALAGARLARGSGHAILDDEALAVARRAAPYPRPPEGVGGGTVSFAVTLRFSR